jgi:hypothetical protein
MFAAMFPLVVGSGVVVRIFLMLGALALGRRLPAAVTRRCGNGTAVRMSSIGLGRLRRFCCPLPAVLIIVVCVIVLEMSSFLELGEKNAFFIFFNFGVLPKYEKLFFCVTQKFDF